LELILLCVGAALCVIASIALILMIIKRNRDKNDMPNMDDDDDNDDDNYDDNVDNESNKRNSQPISPIYDQASLSGATPINDDYRSQSMQFSAATTNLYAAFPADGKQKKPKILMIYVVD
jgi:hypothetical protein